MLIVIGPTYWTNKVVSMLTANTTLPLTQVITDYDQLRGIRLNPRAPFMIVRAQTQTPLTPAQEKLLAFGMMYNENLRKEDLDRMLTTA